MADDIPDEWLKLGQDTWLDAAVETDDEALDAVIRAVAARVRADTANQIADAIGAAVMHIHPNVRHAGSHAGGMHDAASIARGFGGSS